MDRYMLHVHGMPHGGNHCIMQHPDGEYVLYDDAQARIEALEWLVECERAENDEVFVYTQKPCGVEELWAIFDAAREAAGV